MEMSVEDAVHAMAVIESQRGKLGNATADILVTRLLSEPESFWDSIFGALNPPRPETIAIALRTGMDATFADLRDALASE